jgi:hypothetical protein
MINERTQRILSRAKIASATLHRKSYSEDALDTFRSEQFTLFRELNALPKVSGLADGRILRFSVADGYARYVVTEIRTNEVVVEHLPLDDGYIFEGVYNNDRGELLLPRQVAERNVARADK